MLKFVWAGREIQDKNGLNDVEMETCKSDLGNFKNIQASSYSLT